MNENFDLPQNNGVEEVGCESDAESCITETSISVGKAIPEPIDYVDAEVEEDVEVEEDDRYYCQWELIKGSYYPVNQPDIKKQVSPGYYRIHWNDKLATYFLRKKKIKTDGIITLPIKEGEDILADMSDFWKTKDRYKKYKTLHKRGYLMYGPPGSGKTSILHQLIQDLVDNHRGVVFSIENTDDLVAYGSFSQTFREIEPERPIIVILEDVDGLLDDGRNAEKILLNILDGINQIESVAYVATTNYPEKLQNRLKNRPGRFDRRFHIGFPVPEVRKAFFESRFILDDMEKEGFIDQLKELVEKTENFTIAHCKEVFTSTVIKGRSVDEVVAEMIGMNDEKIHSDNDSPKRKGDIGFSGDSKKPGPSGIDWNLAGENLKKFIQERHKALERLSKDIKKQRRAEKAARK